MEGLSVRITAFLLVLAASGTLADTHYVNASNATPASPYTSWTTAATSIQDAIDVADAGDTVLVTNGVYGSGSKVAPPASLHNRIVSTKDIHILSVNGAAATTIKGAEAGYGGCGAGAVRCAYMLNGILEGFTLTGGHTLKTGNAITDRSGGGISGSMARIKECIIRENRADNRGGGAYRGVLESCVVAGNTAYDGGGLFSSTAIDCTISNNTAMRDGGGLSGGTASNCLVVGNTGYNGGGTSGGQISNCTIVDNVARRSGGGTRTSVIQGCLISRNTAGSVGGGGASLATIRNSTVTANVSESDGGGVSLGTIENSVIGDNSAYDAGGGACHATVNSCTVSGNRAARGGGTYSGDVNNCVVFNNDADVGPDISGSVVENSCSPDVVHGSSGNITNTPELVSMSHLSVDSPCRSAGSVMYVTGTDIDGESWLDPPSMGCDEYHGPGSVTGTLTVTVRGLTEIATSYVADFVAEIRGACARNTWDFGDGTVRTNEVYPSHVWTTTGSYDVVLTAYNDDYQFGVSATHTVHVVSVSDHVVYVSAGTGNDANSGTNWAEAKRTIQAGVDIQDLPGGMVLVTNGIYDAGGAVTPGGSLSNRIVVTRDITVRSVNGAAQTTIRGSQATGGGCGPDAVRCVYMTAGVLEGFTLTAGHTAISGNYGLNQSGGGAHALGGTIKRCAIIDNVANGQGGGVYKGVVENSIVSRNSGNWGGGVYYGTVRNCTVSMNSAYGRGGGGAGCTVENSTISRNSAALSGGGVNSGIVRNSIVVYNIAHPAPNIDAAAAEHCCSPELLAGVDGNISDDPMLVSMSHVATNSPCRSAGNVAYAAGTDIDGEPWLDSPSMGCDEYHGPGTATGTLFVAVVGPTDFAEGYRAGFAADIRGTAWGNTWDFGAGAMVTNCAYPSHAWTTPGDYDVVLTAYNDTHPDGVSVTHVVHVASLSTCTLHVSAMTGSDTNSGANWTEAKKTIQGAVDEQDVLGGLVLVTNGVYDEGGKPTPGYSLANRVVVTNDIRIISVNGKSVTTIVGSEAAGGGCGGDAVRCVYMTAGTIDGFTLTNGHTMASGDWERDRSGAGAFALGGAVVRCRVTDCVASYRGGGTLRGEIRECEITGNRAGEMGGGTYYGTISDSLISGNTAGLDGGGSYISAMHNCLIRGNRAEDGAGAMLGTIDSCVFVGNTALQMGGGAYGATVRSSTLRQNVAAHGAGAAFAALDGCAVAGNNANGSGGGTYYGAVENCTVTGNCAGNSGGGACRGTLNNCIVYYNYDGAGSNICCATVSYCCSPGLAHGADGNMTNRPALVSCSHVASNSLCRSAGNNEYVGLSDIDGETWLNPPSIGCDEYHGRGTVTGAVSVGMVGPSRAVESHEVQFAAEIDGQIVRNTWSFGDGTTRTNWAYARHAWDVAGDYEVVLTAYGGGSPSGVAATQVVHVVSAADCLICVSASTGHDGNTGTNWAEAKRTLQAGVDAQITAGGTVLVTNGVYDLGGTSGPYGLLASRVVITNGIRVVSMNGRIQTIIRGAEATGGGCGSDAVRCVCLTDGLLKGFTLTNGHTMASGAADRDRSGGGAYAAHGTVSECAILGNAADFLGGGTCYGIVQNCEIIGNDAENGGGSAFGTIDNCTVAENVAVNYGGGVYGGRINNSIAALNAAAFISSRNIDGAVRRYTCCPGLAGGVDGNVGGDPAFVDPDGGDYRLLYGSPCIDSGTDLSGQGVTNDITGRSRPIDCGFAGSEGFDMGAHEYDPVESDSDGDRMEDAWEYKYGLNPSDGTDADADQDGDMMSSFEEWVAGTVPTDPASCLVIRSVLLGQAGGTEVTWLSASQRVYSLYFATNLMDATPFAAVESNITAAPPQNTCTDTIHATELRGFYRVRVIRQGQ